jgi:hypothetical protein
MTAQLMSAAAVSGTSSPSGTQHDSGTTAYSAKQATAHDRGEELCRQRGE